MELQIILLLDAVENQYFRRIYMQLLPLYMLQVDIRFT